jgi:hypothetical protein
MLLFALATQSQARMQGQISTRFLPESLSAGRNNPRSAWIYMFGTAHSLLSQRS